MNTKKLAETAVEIGIIQKEIERLSKDLPVEQVLEIGLLVARDYLARINKLKEDYENASDDKK